MKLADDGLTQELRVSRKVVGLTHAFLRNFLKDALQWSISDAKRQGPSKKQQRASPRTETAGGLGNDSGWVGDTGLNGKNKNAQQVYSRCEGTPAKELRLWMHRKLRHLLCIKWSFSPRGKTLQTGNTADRLDWRTQHPRGRNVTRMADLTKDMIERYWNDGDYLKMVNRYLC